MPILWKNQKPEPPATGDYDPPGLLPIAACVSFGPGLGRRCQSRHSSVPTAARSVVSFGRVGGGQTKGEGRPSGRGEKRRAWAPGTGKPRLHQSGQVGQFRRTHAAYPSQNAKRIGLLHGRLSRVSLLETICKHHTINHSKAFVSHRRVNNHINGIEGFWSYAKHILYHYRGVSKFHFPMYLKEIEYRVNHRNENLFKRFVKIYFGYVSP